MFGHLPHSGIVNNKECVRVEICGRAVHCSMAFLACFGLIARRKRQNKRELNTNFSLSSEADIESIDRQPAIKNDVLLVVWAS
jgi:hypothetical protein